MKNRIKPDNNAINEIVGTILMVLVTVILSVVVYQVIQTQETPTDITQVNLASDLELINSEESIGGTIIITHKGGDTLEIEKIKIIIADDEIHARERLTDLLARFDFFEIVGEAIDGNEALNMMITHSPDVAFLDIYMPGIYVFQSLDR